MCRNVTVTCDVYRLLVTISSDHAYIPESGVVKVPTAGGLLPYALMACTDQLYCVLCWRLGRGREVAVMSKKGR